MLLLKLRLELGLFLLDFVLHEVLVCEQLGFLIPIEEQLLLSDVVILVRVQLYLFILRLVLVVEVVAQFYYDRKHVVSDGRVSANSS